MSFGDTGAFNASAISCAFWLTLPFLVLMVLIASLRLFCLLCPFPPPLPSPHFPSPVHAVGIGARVCCHLSNGDRYAPVLRLALPLTPAELEKPPFAKEGNGLMGEMSWEVMDESRSGNFSMEVRGEAMDFGTDMLIDRSRDVECGIVVLYRVSRE
jgi:hypothetical protein